MTPQRWTEEADNVLRDSGLTTPGAPTHEYTTVVLAGAVNSAKTSLLRRLLVDTDVTVPAWAGVSAREETAATNAIEVLGCRLVDTPGLQAMSQWHASETAQALLEADAVMLLTTTNLFSASDESGQDLTALSVASGEAFGKPGMHYPNQALAILVTRFDEASLDPTEFPEAYAEARERKLKELAGLLADHAPEAAARAYLDVIAPDPFGRTRERHASPTDYDQYRAWDGVQGVVDWLRTLPPRHQELRESTKIRQRLAALAAARSDLAEGATHAASTAAQAAAAAAEAERLADRIRREEAAAGERLDAAMEKALYLAPQPSDPRFKEELSRLVQEHLQHWAEDTLAAMQELAQLAQASLPHMEVGDPATAARQATDRLLTSPAVSIEDAAALLKMVRTALTGLGPAGTGQVNNTVAEGEALLGWLTPKRVVFLTVVLDAADEVLQLTTANEARRSEDLNQHRVKLTEYARELADQLFTTSDAASGWRGIFEVLHTTAAAAARTAANEAGQAARDEEAVVARLTRVQELLNSCPTPAQPAQDQTKTTAMTASSRAVTNAAGCGK